MRYRSLWFCILVIASNHVLAGRMSRSDMALEDWQWVGSVSIGPVWESGGQAQTLALTPNITKTYTATRTRQSLVEGELFAGIQTPLPPVLQAQLGLAVVTASNASISGNIWDDAASTFSNYSYRYQVQHTHIALKSKLLTDPGYGVIPWISASLGVGINDAKGFKNTPLIPEAVITPNFTSHTEVGLTYTLGAGLQKTLTAHWQAGIGYEFSDWGQSQLGRAAGQTINAGLELNHLHTQGLLFNLTWLGEKDE